MYVVYCRYGVHIYYVRNRCARIGANYLYIRNFFFLWFALRYYWFTQISLVYTYKIHEYLKFVNSHSGCIRVQQRSKLSLRRINATEQTDSNHTSGFSAVANLSWALQHTRSCSCQEFHHVSDGVCSIHWLSEEWEGGYYKNHFWMLGKPKQFFGNVLKQLPLSKCKQLTVYVVWWFSNFGNFTNIDTIRWLFCLPLTYIHFMFLQCFTI